ncbi:outer membrane lipid asymmetry maintenance protein MlaD [Magnetospira thiophila]
MRSNMVETVMGAVVLLVAAMFVFFAYNTAQVRAVSGYEVKAAFFKLGGLSRGADVRISGIKVGTVLDRALDPKTYDAVVTLSISRDIQLPTDTVASIGSEGILGGKYIRLMPGQSTEMLAAGGQITHTQDFRSLEDQVGEIIFLATNPGGTPSPGTP